MSRFKFRIFDIQDKSWMRKALLSNMRVPVYQNKIGSVSLDFAIDRPDLFVVQQFIGFKDKGGQEIFEGDFVDFYTKGHTHGPPKELWSRAQIIWLEKNAEWCFSYPAESIDDEPLTLTILGDGIDPDSFLIVGNIFGVTY